MLMCVCVLRVVAQVIVITGTYSCSQPGPRQGIRYMTNGKLETAGTAHREGTLDIVAVAECVPFMSGTCVVSCCASVCSIGIWLICGLVKDERVTRRARVEVEVEEVEVDMKRERERERGRTGAEQRV